MKKRVLETAHPRQGREDTSAGMQCLLRFDFSFIRVSYEAALLSNGGDEAEHAERASITELAGRLSTPEGKSKGWLQPSAGGGPKA